MSRWAPESLQEWEEMCQSRWLLSVLAASALLFAAACGGDPSGGGGNTGGTGGSGATGGESTGGSGGTAGSGGGNTGGTGGSQRPPPSPVDPDGHLKDHDCDGLSDAEEYGTVYPGGGKTDPTNPDTDGDGIPDGVELGRTSSPDPACAGNFFGDKDPSTTTDPTNPDTDGDGLLDGEEDKNRNGRVDPGETDPNNPDSDGDGIPDGVEVRTGTDPTSRDTDGDGIPDGVEDFNHNGIFEPALRETDPRRADTDGDGLLDGDEDLNWNHVVDPGETDPLVSDNPFVDSDKDGISDADEILLGTDPFDPDTDGDGIPDGIELRSGTDPLSPDTDCDGIPDGEEDRNHNGIVDPGETDPRNPDTDGDGLPDGLELGYTTSPDAACGSRFLPAPAQGHNPTDPLLADTDGDGIPDGEEDRNRNGKVDPDETNPANPDTDGDGIRDGVEVSTGTDPLSKDTDCDGVPDGVEDANRNGVVDPGETDPRNPDTDGDGLPDGLELGYTTTPDPACAGRFVPDSDPATKTDPLDPDTDGDGLIDGLEDANRNGRVDPGERDPRVAEALPAPVAAACSMQNIAPVDLHALREPDLRLATRPAFTESSTLVAAGKEVGRMLYAPGGGTFPDPIAGFVLVRPAGGTPAEVEASLRGLIGGIGSPITQTFTTWDGFPAIRGIYDLSGTGALRARANGIVTSLVSGVSGTLGAGSSPNGPFKLQLEVVVRHPQRAVVVGVLMPAARYAGDNLWRMDDLVNGSALAQFADATRLACESYDATPWPKVDFLWVIDNSGSMGDDQAALVAAADAMGEQLQGATIDWRIATVTTDYDQNGGGNRRITDFTDDIQTFKTNAQPGTNGSGTERGFQPVGCALRGGSSTTCRNGSSTPYFTPSQDGSPSKVRTDSTLVVIFVSDESEQSAGSVQEWIDLFADWDPAIPGRTAIVAGITNCDAGINGSGCGAGDARRTRYTDLISEMGGVHGDLKNLAGISDTIRALLTSIIGATSPYELSEPPISASIKVAIDPSALIPADAALPSCTPAAVPRSRVNGFDYDGASRRLTFHGNCRPSDRASSDALAVSYRSWLDQSPDPFPTVPCGGPCPDPLVCNPQTDQCECPWNCGGRSPGPGFRCDMASCSWSCPADCGGYRPGPGFVCDVNQCAWTCDATCNGQPKPGPNHVCDTRTCSWSCPSDCGGMAPGQFCDRLACAPRCAPDCGGSCGPGFTCDTDSCGCACSGPAVTPAPGFVFDASTCSLVCDPGQVSCGGNRVVDPATCQCVCPEDCGGCTGTCDRSACVCIKID